MSTYSHRGYQHRQSSYGRRRKKSSGFKRKKKTNSVAKVFLGVVGVVAAAAFVFMFVKYLKPFVDSFVSTSQPETADTATASPDIPSGRYDLADNKIFVSGGSAYTMFKGIDKTASNYAAVMNSVTSGLDTDIKCYNMVVPTSTEFNLNPIYKETSYSQRENLDRINSGLMDSIINVDVYDALNAHKDEYLYYRTDENWTAQGAYYAFNTFAETAQLDTDEILTEEDLASLRGAIKNFGGSYLQRTIDKNTQPNGNAELLDNLDTVTFYGLNVNYSCYAIDKSKGYEEELSDLFSIDKLGDEPLSIFPSSNTTLIRILNHDSNNDERLLVVGDSLSDPMLSYLVPCYYQVHIVDTNIYKENLREYIRDNNITQVLFLSSITNANNSLYCQRLRDLFDSSITG